MWIFTKYGFYSAVCARSVDEPSQPAVDAERVIVRSRLLVHLKALRNRFHELLSFHEIEASNETNYAYRMFIPKEIWGEILQALAEEMAYDNFRFEVAKFQRQAGSDYLQTLEKIWMATQQLQPAQPVLIPPKSR
jgi:hypothetical protein